MIELKSSIRTFYENFNSRLYQARKRIFELKDRSVKRCKKKNKKKRGMKNLHDLWNIVKWNNLWIIRIQEGEE